MINVKFVKKEENGNEEYSFTFPMREIHKSSERKLSVPLFPFKKLINELDISIEVLAPYNYGEDFVFLHFSDIWSLNNIYSHNVTAQRLGSALPHLKQSVFFDFLQDAYKNNKKTNLTTFVYYGNKLILKLNQTVFYENGLIFIVNEVLNDAFDKKSEINVFNKYSKGIFRVKDKKIIYKNHKTKEFVEKYQFLNIDFKDLQVKNISHEKFEEITDKLQKKELDSYEDELIFTHPFTFEKYYFTLYMVPANINGEDIVDCTVVDVTDIRNAEQDAEDYARNLENVQKICQFAINYGSLNNLTGWSNEIYEILEIPPKIRAKYPKSNVLFEFVYEKEKELYLNFLSNPEKYNYILDHEFEVNTFKNNKKYLSYHLIYRRNYENEEKSQLTSIVQDITRLNKFQEELKDYNEELSQILKDKEVLLNEVHFRVKNNLQIILSLLNLDMRYNKNNPSITLANTDGYIQSLAFMHEKTYQSDSLEGANVKDYIEDLTESILKNSEVNVNLSTDVENIELSNEIIVPLGLIINELVDNSLEYAFPEGEGNLSINLKSVDDMIELNIKDDGVGLSDSTKFSDLTTLGFTIVQTLTSQIGGKVELLPSDKGVNILLKFSKDGGKHYGI